MSLAWCKYDNKYFRQVPKAVCDWHRYKMLDPKCKNCEEREGNVVFDLKTLGNMVVEAKVPDKSLFQMLPEEITRLGECFLNSILEKDIDPEAQDAKEDGKIPF
jgi:hypothetical protein